MALIRRIPTLMDTADIAVGGSNFEPLENCRQRFWLPASKPEQQMHMIGHDGIAIDPDPREALR